MAGSLIDEARRLTAGRTGTRCGIGRWLDKLDGKERQEWAELLAAEDVPHTVIAAMFQARDVPIQDHTVGTHRRGRCMCGKTAT